MTLNYLKKNILTLTEHQKSTTLRVLSFTKNTSHNLWDRWELWTDLTDILDVGCTCHYSKFPKIKSRIPLCYLFNPGGEAEDICLTILRLKGQDGISNVDIERWVEYALLNEVAKVY